MSARHARPADAIQRIRVGLVVFAVVLLGLAAALAFVGDGLSLAGVVPLAGLAALLLVLSLRTMREIS